MAFPQLIRVAALLLSFVAAGAVAQEYPSKSVRVVVPWAAGGSTDSIGRILAAKLTEYTGHQFIIDNRAGATGTIGHALVSKTPPDGYTLLIGSNSTFAIAPHLYKTLQYDNEASFAPIALLAVSPQILSVHPSIPVKNVKELIALAKAQPGALIFSSAGPGSTSHLATELLMNTAGIKMIHIPYKGGGPSAQALLGGETMLSFVDVITALPFAKAGRLRPLAASTTKRSLMMPDLPTISESGLKGFESSTSFAAFAPAGTPRDIVAKLNKELVRALNAADVKEKLFNQGIETVGSTPEEFVAYNKAESAKWGKVIREQGIKIE
ncbi:MAG: tripartite tricarboxylate transporter substrate binding protein [Burkholderiales bacterium]